MATTIVLAALLVTACSSGGGSDDSGGGEAEGPYVIGVNAELSGPLEFYGGTIADGVQAWADQVNAAGGIDGHEVEIVALDTAGDAARAATNTTQLATSNKVVGIIGHTLSANCSASTPNAERYKIPMACLSVAEPNEWVFSLGPYNPSAASAAISAGVDLSGKDDPRIAVATTTNVTGTLFAEGTTAAAEDQGVEIAATVPFDLTAADLSAATSQLIGSDPDVIVITGTGTNFVNFQRGIRAAGVDVPLVWIDGQGNLGTVADINDPATYAFTVMALPDLDAPEGVAEGFVDAITPLLDTPSVGGLMQGGYAVGYLTATAWGQALEECGYPCTGADLQPLLTKLDTDLSPLVPSFTYDNSLHYPYAEWFLFQVQNGGVYETVGSYPTVIPG